MQRLFARLAIVRVAAWLRGVDRRKRMLSRIYRSRLVWWRIPRKAAAARFGYVGAYRSPLRMVFNTKCATA
jgi:hypothetical protein